MIYNDIYHQPYLGRFLLGYFLDLYEQFFRIVDQMNECEGTSERVCPRLFGT